MCFIASTLVKQRRQHLAERKARLATAKHTLQDDAFNQPMHAVSAPQSGFPPSLRKIKLQQDELHHQLAGITDELAGTRQILLQEVLEALEVAVCSVPGYSYQIACLPVPPLSRVQGEASIVPHRRKRFVLTMSCWVYVLSADLPKHQINATLSLIILLVRLEAHYLGIQLPFVLLGTPTKPLIQALSFTSNAAR